MRTFTRLTALLALLPPLALVGCGAGEAEKSQTKAKAPDADAKAAASVSKDAEVEAAVKANLAKLAPADRELAEAQRYCAVEEENQLGAMGVPVKLEVKGRPVFLCCKNCRKQALADPDKTLARVDALKAKVKAAGPHAGHDTSESKHGHAAHGQDETGGTLMVRPDPARPEAGKRTTLNLMVHGPGGAMVKDFAVVHEQKVHLIVVRDALDHFAHLHPDVDAGGNLTVSYTFPTGGTYLLFADYQPAGGGPTYARGEAKVQGDAPPAPALVPNVPGKVTGDGLAAEVMVSGARPGGEATVAFELTDEGGKPVANLQPYMGAMGHLVVLSADGKEYVHAHPMEGKTEKAGRVAFMVHFTKSGKYKGWGQFKRAGKVAVVPFVAEVQ
jgi:hypothetical protein